jgi:hypothetical protein
MEDAMVAVVVEVRQRIGRAAERLGESPCRRAVFLAANRLRGKFDAVRSLAADHRWRYLSLAHGDAPSPSF